MKFLTKLSFLLAIIVSTPVMAQDFSGRYWQCVTFAREFSGVQLFGNASAWWAQASGKYDRGQAPKIGAILSMKSISSMPAGHVATVTRIVSAREVKLTHANWSPINGRRGQVEYNVSAVDVSPNNDWSQVKVWYAPIGDIGQRVYPVNGFIYPGAPSSITAPVQTASGDHDVDAILADMQS